jgi:hypothetical protein
MPLVNVNTRVNAISIFCDSVRVGIFSFRFVASALSPCVTVLVVIQVDLPSNRYLLLSIQRTRKSWITEYCRSPGNAFDCIANSHFYSL